MLNKIFVLIDIIRKLGEMILALTIRAKKNKLKEANEKSVDTRDQRHIEEALTGKSSGPTKYKYNGLRTRKRRDNK